MNGRTDLVDIQNLINNFNDVMNKLVDDWYESTCVINVAKKSKFKALGFNRSTLDDNKLRELKEQYKDKFELKFYQRQVFDKNEFYCFIIIDDNESTINYEEFIQNKDIKVGDVILELNGLTIKASDREDELSMIRYMGMLNFSRLFSIAKTIILDDCSFDIDTIAPTVRTRRMEVERLEVNNCKFEQCTKISKLTELFPALKELEVKNTKFGNTMILDDLLNDSRVRAIDFTGTDFGKIKSAERAFYNCINLIEINGINNWNLTECESCSRMFMHCSDLKRIDISNWKPEHTDLKSLFNQCYKLQIINMENIRFYTNKVSGMINGINSDVEIILKNKIKFFDDFNKPLDVAGLLELNELGNSKSLSISKQLFDITPVEDKMVQSGMREVLSLVDKLIQFKLEENDNYFAVQINKSDDTLRNILQDLKDNIYRQKEKVISNQMEIVNISKKEFIDNMQIKNDIMGNKCRIFDFYIGLLIIGNSADECKVYIMNGGE